MIQLQDREVWAEDGEAIVARGPIYRFSNGRGDEVYGRSIEELRDRDRFGIIPRPALYAVADDAEAFGG